MTCAHPTDRNLHPPPRAAAARGFSLMEVLMAAFVMGLGVLGLTALFAGAARQQQVASLQTRAAMMLQGAEATLIDRLGVIEDSQCASGGLDHPCPASYPDDLVDDVWYPAPMEEFPQNLAPSAGAFLTLNPDGGSSWVANDLYMRLEPTNKEFPILLFRSDFQRGSLMVAGNSGIDPGLGNSTITTPPFSNGAPALETSFGDVRLIADSLKLRVVTYGFPCVAGERRADQPDRREIEFTINCQDLSTPIVSLGGSDGGSFIEVELAPGETDLVNGPYAGIRLIGVLDVLNDLISDVACDGQSAYVETSPTAPGARELLDAGFISSEHLQLAGTTVAAPGYAFENPGDTSDQTVTLSPTHYNDFNGSFESGATYYEFGGGQYSLTSGAPTGIFVRELRAPWRYVHEVWLDGYQVRGHKMVSLADRVIVDSAGDPTMAYGMLFRRTSDGGTQYAIMAYSLAAAQGNAEGYLPPETCADFASAVAPLREASLVLRYDTDLARFFVEPVNAANDAWAVAKGQRLLFMGDPDPSVSPPIPGADAAVEIQFIRVANGVTRGYLDTAPRAGLRNLLGVKHPADDAFSTTGETFRVWAVQPSVRSALDNSAWNLEAFGATVFQPIE